MNQEEEVDLYTLELEEIPNCPKEKRTNLRRATAAAEAEGPAVTTVPLRVRQGVTTGTRTRRPLPPLVRRGVLMGTPLRLPLSALPPLGRRRTKSFTM